MRPMVIVHRVNTVGGLSKIPSNFGVEVDIRGCGDQLVVHHDPLLGGVDLGAWMDACCSRMVVFNVKEEGIERRVVDMAHQRGIHNFFLLDLSFPALVKMVSTGESRVAVRVSEYESPAGALSLAHLASWVWLDIFNGLALSASDYEAIKNAGFSICLVSPELYPDRGETEVQEIQEELNRTGIEIDAVCTKHPDWWGW